MSKYTTGEIAKLCGVSVRTVQYYDERGILIPSELSEGGRRLYSEDDYKKLKIICFLRDAGISIKSIGELLSESNPSRVISVLLEKQEQLLQNEVKERQEQLAMLEGIKKALKGIENFSVESIGDIAYAMENKKKMKQLHAVLLITGIPLNIIQWVSIILWITTGIQWLFWGYILVAIPYAIFIIRFLSKKIVYICPQCHEIFKPHLKEFIFSNHSMTLRKLTCTSCGYHGFCVEPYQEVLTGLNLSVPEHSVFGFVGENGAGKTTTMKIILGLLKSDRGEVFVSGERVKYGQTATNRYIGYLPDVPEFYSFMTAREYLRLCGESLEMGKNDIEKRSDELLTLVGLSKENHRIRGFSRGMKQRLGIAQALLGRPKILICDEPTSALDPIGRKEILDILLSSKKQTTVLFSTHILSDVERICTDVAFLNNGKIAMQGAVADLKNVCSSHEFIVETIKADDAEYLSSVFTDAQLTAKDTLLFLGEQFKMFEVLEFITEHKILISKIERVEPSLESLFMEVVSK